MKQINCQIFIQSPLEKMILPSKVLEINDFFFENVLHLYDIVISNPNNSKFYFDGNLLLKKNNQRNEYFDEIFFAQKKINKVIIASSIKRIAKNAFDKCEKLQNVQFMKNSKLEIIENNAFSNTSIRIIDIPNHVKIIGQNAFCYCEKLTKVNLNENSELNAIEHNSFRQCPINCFFFPSSITTIDWENFMHVKIVEIQNNVSCVKFESEFWIQGKDIIIMCHRIKE